MKTKEFNNAKLGDKVKCLESFSEIYPLKNWMGTIIFKDSKRGLLGIEWENRFYNGHNGRGHGKNGFCRNYDFTSKLNHENLSIIELLNNKQLELEF